MDPIADLLAQAAGADFVKTGSGFGPGGAEAATVGLMRRVLGPEAQVQAAGGIQSLEAARALVLAGASRLSSCRP